MINAKDTDQEVSTIFEIQKITDSKINELSLRFEDKAKDYHARFMPLKINGLADKAGYKAVYEARQIVKKERIRLEKDSKEFKSIFRNAISQIDEQAAKFLVLLKPIEDHLSKEEKAIDEEEVRIKKAKEEAAQARLQKRIDILVGFKHPIHMQMISAISDEEFEVLAKKAEADFIAFKELEEQQAREQELIREAQRKKEEEEAAIRRLELEKLAQERREREEERKRLEAERKAIEDEKEALAAIERGRIAAENAKLREQEAIAMAKAQLEAENKKKEEARALEELKMKQEAERLEAMKPDKERLLDLIVNFKKNLFSVSLSTDDAKAEFIVFETIVKNALISLEDFCRS